VVRNPPIALVWDFFDLQKREAHTVANPEALPTWRFDRDDASWSALSVVGIGVSHAAACLS
jgi:hypothetical protein